MHAPSRTPLLLPLLLSHNLPTPPRSLVRDEQTHPHRPRLVVSHSTCPPLSSPPHAHSFVLGPAVIKHTRQHSQTPGVKNPNLWREECSGSARQRAWKRPARPGRCRAFPATALKCDNLVRLPVACRLHCAEVRGQLLRYLHTCTLRKPLPTSMRSLRHRQKVRHCALSRAPWSRDQ